MKISFYTLGCKTNQYETQAMENLLLQQGHTIGSFDEKCDCYVINTCSVTAVADKKNRAVIRRCRRENPEAIVAVCGCYTQHDPEVVKELGVDVIGGSGNRQQFLADLLDAAQGHQYRQSLDNALSRREFEVLPAGGLEERTRAMLKIQDGCVNFCTYCIIPYARGGVRSLPKAVAVEQTAQLRQEGYRELVFTGIEISSWGHDLKTGETLIDLLEAVSAAAGDMRLRLGSLEPRTITEDFCRRASKLPNLCPHFHLSLQSGCDETLRRMNRKYDTARFYQSVTLLRAYFDRPAVTTDLICGFPGETEEEFARTLAFIEKCGFAAMHIFPYSIRPGTKAAAMEQLSAAVKERRAARAAEVASQMHRAYLEGCVGQVYPVLFEQEKDGYYTGHAPNYCETGVRGEDLHNKVLDVKITGTDGDMLIGELT